MILRNKRLLIILNTIALFLLIPFVAMLLTNKVNWTSFDFIIAGFLLLITGLAIGLVLRKVRKKQNRIALLITILALLFLIWIELAVGVFGSPFSGS